MNLTTETTCAGCGRDTDIDLDAGTATVYVESNGRRGAGHVAAHTVTVDGMFTDGLFMWDCPACEYADSIEDDAR